MSRLVFIVSIFAIGFTHCFAAKILCVFPTPIRSHFIFASELLKGLADKGHQVTVLSSFPLEKPWRNYRDIKIETGAIIDTRDVMDKIGSEGWSYFGSFRLHLRAVGQILQAANFTLHTREFQKISEEPFDLVLVEVFSSTFLIGLGDHFKCPMILIFSGPPTIFINELSGNPSTDAYVPHFLLGKGDTSTFLDRMLNFGFTAAEKIIWAGINWVERSYYQANFPSPKYRSYDEMKRNVSLYIVNDHFTATSSRPYVPAVIPVGGLHIKTKIDPLPQDIQDFIENAEDGVIFFSLGSFMKTSFLSPEMLNDLFKVFSKLKQKILMKWEDEDHPDQPRNVLAKKWMPQADILAHKNIKIFITHGGLGSLYEAKYHGVPIVGIPFFADQKKNLKLAEEEGWAVTLDFREFSEETFSMALSEVLKNPKFRNSAKYLSALFKDRPMTALETGIYWTEYVIRHKGAPHLRSKAADLFWWQRISLDVLIAYLILIWLIYKLISFILSLWWGKHCRSKKIISKVD